MSINKSILRMTASERAIGRFLRAPDHDASTGGGEEGNSSEGSGQAPAKDEKLTTEQQLEQEFPDIVDEPEGGSDADDGEDDGDDGREDTGASADDDGADEGEDGEGEGGDDADESKGSESEGGDDDNLSDAQKARIAELTERAEKAEKDAADAREAAEKAGVSLDSADDGTALPEEPDASKYEFGEHDQNYIKDRAKWEAKMELLADQAKARFKAEATSLEAKWTKNLAGAVSKYPDFDEVVVKGAEENKWACPPVISLAIKDSEYGPDIAYSLAKDPNEALRISKLSPLEQAREFGRLEERQHVKANPPAPPKEEKPEPRKETKAPTPPKRRVSGAGGKFGTAPDTDDFRAFEKMADQRLQNAGR